MAVGPFFHLIFAIVGTLTPVAPVSARVVALFALMIDSDGLTRMRPRCTMFATLGCFLSDCAAA